MIQLVCLRTGRMCFSGRQLEAFSCWHAWLRQPFCFLCQRFFASFVSGLDSWDLEIRELAVGSATQILGFGIRVLLVVVFWLAICIFVL